MKPAFNSNLLRWYRESKRDLPWRRTKDPYRILLSEVMLQQTQVDTVIPYYHRFLERYPSFAALAKAPLDGILKQWEGLGYYSRARNLHALAQTVSDRSGGRLPDDFDALIELPGIGRYTAGAVLSIAFNKDYPVLDGNVMRVLARYFAIQKDIADPSVKEELWALAAKILSRGQAGDYNQALMELGAMVCTPRNPNCPRCPVKSGCKARALGLQDQIPFKRKKNAIPHKIIGAGVIWHKNKILIGQRPLAGLLGGLWEFPGGKKEKGETLPDCVKREIKEELNVDVRVGKKLAEVKHAYSHFKITLHAYDCIYQRGKPKAIGCRAWKWVKPEELTRYAFPAANQPIIKKLLHLV